MTEDEAKEDTEWDDLLKEASEEELVDLAGNTRFFTFNKIIRKDGKGWNCRQNNMKIYLHDLNFP